MIDAACLDAPGVRLTMGDLRRVRDFLIEAGDASSASVAHAHGAILQGLAPDIALGLKATAGRRSALTVVDESNRCFALAIARGQGMKLNDVAPVHGTGKTFSARRALANGAIDGIATLRDVIGQHASPRARPALMRRQAALAELARSI